MRWILAPVLAVATLAASPAVGREHELDPMDFTLRRAALEIAAGRAQAALEALERMPLDSRAGEREALGLLLAAEAEILSGRRDSAVVRLAALESAREDAVRARAAAHAVGLALENAHAWAEADPTALAAVSPDLASSSSRALDVWERERGELD